MFFPDWLSSGWRLGLARALVFVGTLRGVNDCAKAQIIPDNTLEDESSVVMPLIPNSPVEQITGGATRGANLFHSFQEFNVNNGQAAYFQSPTGIENIISRVTGGNHSEILGRLGVLGNANLFLINPNGIIFGPNARLNIGGSFVATTANAIGFSNQGFFNATAPNLPPVLTVNPSALLFNQIVSQPITNQSVAGLQLPANRSLLLVGGDVNLEGGKLIAPSGRVQLGGLAEAGKVGLIVDGNNLGLSFPVGVRLSDISLTNKAVIDASFNGSGDIQVQGRRVALTDSSEIVTNTLESERGGTLAVRAAETVEVIGGSRLLAETQGTGAAGDLTIETGRLIIQDGAQVAAGSFNGGQGGTLSVRAAELVELRGTAKLANGEQVPSRLLTQAEGTGAAGDLRIETGQMTVRDGAQVSTSTRGSGQGGTLTVVAPKSVQLIGTSKSADTPNPSGLFAVTQGGSGKSGDLTIETGQLIVRDGAQVSTSTVGGGQQGGTLTISAKDSVQLIGTSANGQVRSGLLVGTTGSGVAGDLRIETGQMTVQDRALVSVRTTPGSTGSGGSIIINNKQLNVLNGAEVNLSSEGSGNAGNLKVATRSIRLDNQALLSSNTTAGQGNIFLRSGDLVLRRGSNITTNATGTATGGNITIDASMKRGKNVQQLGDLAFKTQGIFRTADSDITASSELGTEFNGTVDINTPGVEPNSGLINLPIQLVEARVAQTCQPIGNQAQSEFVVTGRGGLPPSPDDTLSSDAIQVDWVSLNPKVENRSSPDVSTNSTAPDPTLIVEATGWIIGDNGEVILTASAPSTTPNKSWQTPAKCHATRNSS